MGAFGGGENGKHAALPCERGVLNTDHDIIPALQGLGNLDRAVDAWKRALGALPIENVTAAQQKQREQYSSKFEAAEAKSKSRNTNPRQPEGAVEIPRSDLGSLPWERAKLMIPDLMASQTWDSSVRRVCTHPSPEVILTFVSGCVQAWVIERAYSVSWQRLTLTETCVTLAKSRFFFPVDLGGRYKRNERRPRTANAIRTRIHRSPWCKPRRQCWQRAERLT